VRGGRWYERGSDGSETPWGRVRVWQPPHRVVLAWYLDENFDYQPELVQGKELEVRFTAIDDSATQIDLYHRGFPATSVWLLRSGAAAAHGHQISPLTTSR
jgi:uncharacterized protein YndB with AHSA1/START domain